MVYFNLQGRIGFFVALGFSIKKMSIFFMFSANLVVEHFFKLCKNVLPWRKRKEKAITN